MSDKYYNLGDYQRQITTSSPDTQLCNSPQLKRTLLN